MPEILMSGLWSMRLSQGVFTTVAGGEAGSYRLSLGEMEHISHEARYSHDNRIAGAGP